MSERVKAAEFKKAIQAFCHDHGCDQRYASFDYCYQYFHSFKPHQRKTMADAIHLQESCLQLAFYLASWGMFRGSSFLLQRSSRHFQPLVEWLSTCDRRLWTIDIDQYSEPDVEMLLQAATDIRTALGGDKRPSDTLVTKIMLGVFGNTPAFDQFVKKAFGIHSFCRKNLLKLGDVYKANRRAVDSISVHCYDFSTGTQTGLPYTKAKIIDMYGFITGQQQ